MLLFLVAGKSGCLRKGQGAQWLRQESAGNLARREPHRPLVHLPPHQREVQRPRFPFRVSQRQLGTLPPWEPNLSDG